MPSISNLSTLLRHMEPQLQPGLFAFARIGDQMALDCHKVVASIREPEGMSVVMEIADVEAAGLTPVFRCRWIILAVHSDLQAVGLTAAFAAALANSEISCNVIAGVHHDHLFVPETRAQDAIDTLLALQQRHEGLAGTMDGLSR